MTDRMTAKEVISDLRLMGPQDLCVIFAYLGEHLFGCETADGNVVLRSVTTERAQRFLCELSEEARKSESTEVPLRAELSTRLSVTGCGVRRQDREEQPRWKSDPVCPDCNHVHEGRAECSKYLGEGKFCKCESKVTA